MSDTLDPDEMTVTHESAIADATDGRRFGHRIGGGHAEATSADRSGTVDPAVAIPIIDVVRGGSEEVDAAVSDG